MVDHTTAGLAKLACIGDDATATIADLPIYRITAATAATATAELTLPLRPAACAHSDVSKTYGDTSSASFSRLQVRAGASPIPRGVALHGVLGLHTPRTTWTAGQHPPRSHAHTLTRSHAHTLPFFNFNPAFAFGGPSLLETVFCRLNGPLTYVSCTFRFGMLCTISRRSLTSSPTNIPPPLFCRQY